MGNYNCCCNKADNSNNNFLGSAANFAGGAIETESLRPIKKSEATFQTETLIKEQL